MDRKSMLIISDDLALFEQLYGFFAEQYHIELAQNELSGVSKLFQLRPDVIILSYHLPRLSGLEVCRQIRQSTSSPIIMIGHNLPLEERINGYEAGADEVYISPIECIELYYKITVLLRRSSGERDKQEEPNAIVFGQLVMNRSSHKAYIDGKELTLTRKEFSLLWILTVHANQVVRRNQLIKVIWGYDHIGDDRMIDTHLNRLRNKLKKYGSDVVITTVWGLGYKVEKINRLPSSSENR